MNPQTAKVLQFDLVILTMTNSYSGTDVLSASYQSVHRPKSNDFTWKLSQPVQVPVDGNAVRVNHEFIELTLILANGGNVTEHLFQVLRTPERKLKLSWT